jgi:hypothetical protein
MSSRSARVSTFREATPHDAAPIAALRCASADALTAMFGRGPWSSLTTERGVLSSMRHSKVLVARTAARRWSTSASDSDR